MTEETCGCCGSLIKEGPVFNQRFADYGWCAYDTISEELVHRANQTFEEEGMEAAQRVLIEYYKTEAPKQVEHILNASPSFAMREGMIRQCFEDHAEGRYYASVPLSLIITARFFRCSTRGTSPKTFSHSGSAAPSKVPWHPCRKSPNQTAARPCRIRRGQLFSAPRSCCGRVR